MRNKNQLEQLIRKLPTKWAIAIVALVIVYAFAQPVLKKQLGIPLPGIAQLTGDSSRMAVPPEQASSTRSSQAKESTSGKTENRSSSAAVESSSPNPAFEDYLVAISPPGASNQSLLYDLLEPLGKGRYQSPGGLIYTRSSADRHRILHVARHLEDQPSRPGKHGVFDGDIGSLIRLIDDAYNQASSRERGTKTRSENDRTVIEVEFNQPIGYVGGKEGNRRGKPSAKSIRLVVADKNVITAFPF